MKISRENQLKQRGPRGAAEYVLPPRQPARALPITPQKGNVPIHVSVSAEGERSDDGRAILLQLPAAANRGEGDKRAQMAWPVPQSGRMGSCRRFD